MWIAKNSITGRTYGKPYSSIYDCQLFIDKHLKLLEYEFRRCFSLEEKFISDIDKLYELQKKGKCNVLDIIYNEFQLCISDFTHEIFNDELLKLEVQKCFTKHKYQRDVEDKIQEYVKTNWLKNNIIRCFNEEQKRFADGFDF